MFSAVIAFLGSTAFKWLGGELLGLFKNWQEQRQELKMLQATHEMDRDKHQWQMEAAKLAADQGLKIIEAKSEAASRELMDTAFLRAVEGTNTKSGIGWVDGWNGAIRPALATLSIVLIGLSAASLVDLAPSVLDVICAVLGLYVGGRINATGR